MPAYHPMRKHMEKLDEWGSNTSKKLSGSREGSMTDRFKAARGKDDRWEQTKPVSANADEDQTNIVPQRSARAGQLPPPPPSLAVNKARPPPPPARTASGSGVAPPPPPARGKAPAPPLPRRMDNEAGTDRPPPPYANNNTASSSLPRSNNSNLGYIEFSKFTNDDKQAFFDLLDEFFASRSSENTRPVGESSTLPKSTAQIKANDRLPIQNLSITKEAPKPSGPGVRATLLSDKSQSKSKATAVSSPAYTYPTLSASSLPSSELCSALTCSTFLCYPDSYPEWSGPQPWFTKPNATPTSLEGRADVTRTSSWQYSGTNYTLFGAALFADLSYLWWKITWNSNNAAKSVKSQVAYREPPTLWQDNERLIEAHTYYGDWIASFAETNERNRTPVGDGECWTLAAEAIKYTNTTAQLTEENRLLTTVGRTHGYLLYAGKADEIKGQCGRWRGGDVGRIRRGDIIEWKTAKCGLKDMRGATVTLGNPEHTAVIVEDSPTPNRDFTSDSSDHYSVLGVSNSASAGEIRGAYLQKARQHHPDKRMKGNNDDDDYIQRLNEAHSTLSDVSLRANYDNQLSRNGAKPGSSRVSAEIDLDSMQVVEDYEPMTFYHACRCGNGFYIDEEQMQKGQDVVSCTGCSEQIRVLWKDDQNDPVKDDSKDQTSLAPWELGCITTIEQSAGQVPSRRTYDLSQGSFTKGDMWIYRPVWESVYLGGPLNPAWPPSLAGWQQLV